jgi:hypothetical protein
MAKEEPKVVDVIVGKYDGFAWGSPIQATVTLDDGTSRTGYGSSDADAIQDASNKAQESSWWSRKLFG